MQLVRLSSEAGYIVNDNIASFFSYYAKLKAAHQQIKVTGLIFCSLNLKDMCRKRIKYYKTKLT
jgi:hypothetical protein